MPIKLHDRSLLRLVTWGLSAAFAAATLVIIADSPAGRERIGLAMVGLNEPSPPTPSRPVGGPLDDALVRSLEARVTQLSADRDRLAARLTRLENGFDDLTGSVRRQATAGSGPATPQPVPARVETVEPKPLIVAVAPPLINPLATPPAGIASILPETSAPTPATKAAVVESAVTEPAPAAVDVPLPPERIAAVAPAEVPKPAAVPARTEYGIELGVESSMDGLRQRWASVKANYGPLLVGLSPVAVRDRHTGATTVRLVAGPLPNLNAARQLCARVAAMNGNCWPARINPADVVQ